MHYLATFQTVVGDICQGIVHFPAGPRRQTFYPDRWFSAVERLSAARTGIPGCEISLRTNLREGQADQLAYFHAPLAAEGLLRPYLASFFELLALADGSVVLPLDRAAYDQLANPWTRYLCRVQSEHYIVGPAWLVCKFRVSDFLPEILDEAVSLGHDVLHQIHLKSFALSPQQEGRARRNLVALENIRGMPAATFEIQRRILNMSAGEVTLAEEYVGAASLGGASWLQHKLRRRFQEGFGAAKLESPSFEFHDTGFSKFLRSGGQIFEAVASGFHSATFEEPDDQTVYASAACSRLAKSLFSWSPSLRRWFEPSQTDQKKFLLDAYSERERLEGAEATAAASQAFAHRPPLLVCEGGTDYAFISYRRADFKRILPILSGLNVAGCSFWFDASIPGGSDWLGELQDRVRRARTLVLFLSRAASESRYVRLEVSFAFSIGKPILPVRLEELDFTNLPGGLGLILNSIQAVDLHVGKIIEYLQRFS
jgi:hypothetical protein